ncbi:4-phosphoerythronate dehydrogenase [Pseudoalteromonas sp. T1lg88]|uniref:4-phosphoerythronate dehydrogenase n=1 Tax=Pseudoalteromonas sp. T1lg88 TaxID=2077104 RepID=UPI000CF68D46|nr:4-phosphoerythronate dehydrogenase [Pseudoalteromonas sp. T1lg88]
MKILADQNMPLVDAFFAPLGEIERFDGRALTPEMVKDADVLLTRSVTQVNAELLAQNTSLKFVGTATIGVDHIDQAYLAERQVPFASAPGCNAVAVAEYVLSAVFALAQEQHFSVFDKTIAIVGVGNIGQCLADKLAAIGVKTLLVDPPRQTRGDVGDWHSLETALAEADIITFHVPLVKDGEHCTYHLLDKQRIDALSEGKILINASRGDVIDNQALLARQQAEDDLCLVLDVWENEPDILEELLPYVELATVHIAGHTLEGKGRGTLMLYQALCQHLDLTPNSDLAQHLPTPSLTQLTLSESWSKEELGALVHLIYDVRRDDAILRAQLHSHGFDLLRKTYPVRRELSTLTLSGSNPYLSALAAFGFSI